MFDWLTKLFRRPKPAPAPAADEQQKAANPQNVGRLSRLRPFLAGANPGQWASNHYEEIKHLRGWVYTAIRALALQCAQATATAFVVNDDGEHEPLDRRHPLMRLLRRPNPGQKGASFRYQLAQQLTATGTAFVWTVRTGFDIPAELYCIPTPLATPQMPTAEFPMGSYRIAPMSAWSTYMDTDPDGFSPGTALGQLLLTGGWLDFRDVKAIRWPHPLFPSDGLSPLTAGATTVDVAEQLERARWYDFKNGSRPGRFFNLNAEEWRNISDEDRDVFREDLRARASGTANTGKDMVLPPGVTSEQASLTPAEMAYVESWSQARDGVLALFATPPIAVGGSEAGSYAAFYASLKQFTELSVRPMLMLIAEDLKDALECGPWRHVEIGLEPRAIDDPTVKEARLAGAAKAGVMKVNEYRKEIGLEPLSDEEGGEDLIGKASDSALARQEGAVPGKDDPPPRTRATEERTGVKDPGRGGPKRAKGWEEQPRVPAGSSEGGEWGEGGAGGNPAPAAPAKPKPAKPKFGKSKAKVETRPNVTPQEIDKALAGIFPGKGKGKSRIKREDIASLVGAPDDAVVTVGCSLRGDKITVDVAHPAYTASRVLYRDGGKTFIKNNEFWMKSSSQGAGLGSEVFARQVENAQAMGVDYIECHAAKVNPKDPPHPHNGYYTWARLGYDQEIDLFDDDDKDERAVKKLIRETYPDAKSVLDITATVAGRDWWKTNGCDLMNAQFDLAPQGRSMRVMDDYLAERAARAATKRWRRERKAAMSDNPHVEEIELTAEEEEALEAAERRREEEATDHSKGFDPAEPRDPPSRNGVAHPAPLQ